MAASDNIYFNYYSFESLSFKWNHRLPSPSRRIQIIPPNAIDTKSSSVGGPPAYDPGSMSHTQQKLFRQKLLYVAPLAYYALRTIRPWCFGIDPSDETLSAWVSVSTTEGEDRVNLGDIIAPWAKGNISLLDPATWIFLVQLYNGLPEHYSRYRLALNDPYLPMLSTIPSTPRFSIITLLDLSNCHDLHDSNISQLKVLTSLSVLDTSCTHLTDQAVKNLMSTLLLEEPGPLRLQSWSLRGCGGVTNRCIEPLGCFPMLCLLDLRETSVKPHQLMYKILNWELSTLKSPKDHVDFFWPQPQSGIPALIQDLNNAAYSTRAEGHGPEDKPPRPWVIHIDRQYPSNWGIHRIPYWKPAQTSGHLPWYSYDYSDIDVDSYYDSDSGDSFGEEGDLSSEEFDPSSPLEPTSSIFGDNESLTPSRVEPRSMADGADDSSSSDDSISDIGETQASSHRIAPTAGPQPLLIDSNSLVDDLVIPEPTGTAPGVPHFYDARAQAGLALPKVRKRPKVYSSASSESYDSEEERIKCVSNKDWSLMFLRKPPEWSEVETLMATVRAWKQHKSQNAPTRPDLSSAKKRKVSAGGMAARWAQMKASSKAPSQASIKPVTTSHHTTIARSTASSKSSSLTMQIPTSTQENQAPVRRTTLGRAPRPPGTILRKPR